MYNIVILGTGNIASALFHYIKNSNTNINVCGIYEEDIKRLNDFNKIHSTDITGFTNVNMLPLDADIYIFAISDHKLNRLWEKMTATKGIWVHTSGSTSLDSIRKYHDKVGVIYPMQSINKHLIPNVNDVPVFIESSDNLCNDVISDFCSNIFTKIYYANSEQRKALHLSAVFASNFTNHLYSIGYDILNTHCIDANVLIPLIKHTANRLGEVSPKDVQTGPAIRFDDNTLSLQKNLLLQEADKDIFSIYDIFTNSIQKMSVDRTKNIYKKTCNMSCIPHDLMTIKAFVLDMDGVISCTVSPVDVNGMPMRTVNVKDGYAMNYAVKKGFIIAIISGGYSQAMRYRFEQLGTQYIYMNIKDKESQLKELCDITGLSLSEIAYIGDDIPDIGVMSMVGLPCAPSDAIAEVKQVAKYISPYKGGEGVVRDVIEQTLKVQKLWSKGEGFGW